MTEQPYFELDPLSSTGSTVTPHCMKCKRPMKVKGWVNYNPGAILSSTSPTLTIDIHYICDSCEEAWEMNTIEDINFNWT